jgi:type I restriction enzyme S subunit
MSNLKPYSNFTDFRQEWLGELPSHWEVKRTKLLFDLITEAAPVGNTEELLSVYTALGVRPRKELEARGNKASTTDNYWRVEKGDIIVNKLLAWMGAIGISEYKGVTSPAYDILRPSENVNPYFYNYLFRNPIASREFKRHSRGIMDMRLRLYFTRFGDIKLPYPPFEEQNKIVDYLQFKLKKIDNFILKKKQLLSLYVERRKSLTRQIINSDTVQFLRLSSITNSKQKQIERLDNEYYTPIGLYNRGRGIFHKEKTLGKDLGDSSFYHIQEGDVILSGQFAWEGAVALANSNDKNCVASHRYPILNCNLEIIRPEFLFSFFTIPEGHFFLDNHSRGSAGRNRPLNPRYLIKEKIPVPSINLQEKLIEMFKSENRLKAIINSEITIVEEYKTALIAEAVTGKIDVRGFKVPEKEEPLAMVAEEASNYNKAN